MAAQGISEQVRQVGAALAIEPRIVQKKGLAALPSDIHARICNFVDYADILSMAACSTQTRSVVSDCLRIGIEPPGNRLLYVKDTRHPSKHASVSWLDTDAPIWETGAWFVLFISTIPFLAYAVKPTSSGLASDDYFRKAAVWTISWQSALLASIYAADILMPKRKREFLQVSAISEEEFRHIRNMRSALAIELQQKIATKRLIDRIEWLLEKTQDLPGLSPINTEIDKLLQSPASELLKGKLERALKLALDSGNAINTSVIGKLAEAAGPIRADSFWLRSRSSKSNSKHLALILRHTSNTPSFAALASWLQNWNPDCLDMVFHHFWSVGEQQKDKRERLLPITREAAVAHIIDQQNSEGESLLSLALKRDPGDCVAFTSKLLAWGASTDTLHKGGKTTLLHLAVVRNQPCVVAMLIGRGASMTHRDSLGVAAQDLPTYFG